MQYGQIVLLITVGFALYYIAMIAMDIQRANAAKAAEAENDNEEDIDISDEAKQFNPIKVNREERPKAAETQTDSQALSADRQSKENTLPAKQAGDEPNKEERKEEERQQEEQAPSRPNLHEPIMTDGIDSEKLIALIDKGAETGDYGLGQIIMFCDNAKYEQ